MPSTLQNLPADLQRMIFLEMDYQSLIFLSATNRYFNRAVNPQALADPDDKLEFVMRAAKDFPQHRPNEKANEYNPGNLECYICFRVLLPDRFDTMQATSIYMDRNNYVVRDRCPEPGEDKLVMLRRFCIECGVRTGLHVPSDCLTTKTGRDLWVCRCRRVWPKPGILRCPECGGDCPLRPKRRVFASPHIESTQLARRGSEYLDTRQTHVV